MCSSVLALGKFEYKANFMEAKSLYLLLGLYALHALLKFGFFFVLSYDYRRKALDKAYAGRVSATKAADIFLLVFVAILVALLAERGTDHASFLTGLLVGMTLVQVYFHQFTAPLVPDEAPDSPLSPIKMMSYAIQAKPSRPWKEVVFIACLLVWSLHGLVVQCRVFG